MNQLQILPFMKEWLADGQILCYSFSDIRRESIDLWVADLTEELNRWPADKKLMLIHDIRERGVSPYGLQCSRKVSLLRPELSGRNAILIPSNSHLVAQLVSICIRTLSNDKRQRLAFTDEAAAVAWLLEQNHRA
jgi:hypothetical protein